MKLTENSKSKLNFPKNTPVIILILSVGILARYVFFLSISGPLETSDSPTYIDGAMSLYYHLLLNEYRPPVYPFGLMVVGVLFYWSNVKTSIIILQVFLSLVNIVLVYLAVNEAFQNRTVACLSSLITAVSFRVFSWDFAVLTENFSILIITLVVYYTIKYIKNKQKSNFKRLIAIMLIAIFTKPFFLLLPVAVFSIFILRQFVFRDFGLMKIVKVISMGTMIVYSSVFLYSLVNFAENSFFGLTSVGNVNYFGKVLQYKMESLGSNPDLQEDIRYAFKVEQQEYKVNGKYLEPWHFVGSYGWDKKHYSELGRFSKEIILKHPIRYTSESLKLTYQLFMLNSPFRDYIADAALQKANHTHTLFKALRKLTETIDFLYLLLVLCLFETVYTIASLLKGKSRRANAEKDFFICAIMLIILYHYFVSAFFSYGDYCRLLVPCYPLIYIIISLYLHRFAVSSYNTGIIIVKSLKGTIE